MGRAERWDDELAELAPTQWPAFLTEHSGLPGPRANLRLVAAAARMAEDATVELLAGSTDEYLLTCAAAALGRRADDAGARRRARALASCGLWRVRLGVEQGLQMLGDKDPEALRSVVEAWVQDADPLVKRAAVAAICEPRLLRSPESAVVAVSVCAAATRALPDMPIASKKSPGVRALRQALGYCWSVAVAADPEPGFAAFRALDASDPDVAWIVRENRKKKRLARLE